jgi:hypothetical protein
MMPVSAETAAVNASTRASSVTPFIRGKVGPAATIRSIPHAATSSPSAPPAAESSRLSVSSCRTTRVRLAPSAVRMAISR